jgi:hypothetical protein
MRDGALEFALVDVVAELPDLEQSLHLQQLHQRRLLLRQHCAHLRIEAGNSLRRFPHCLPRSLAVGCPRVGSGLVLVNDDCGFVGTAEGLGFGADVVAHFYF